MRGGRRTHWAWQGTPGAARRWVLAALIGASALIGSSAARGDGSWTLPSYMAPHVKHLRLTLDDQPLANGYSATFLAVNDAAAAVGEETNGTTSYPIYYGAGTLTNLQPILGTGFLDSIAAPGYAVGQAGGHPVFYDPGSPPVTLDVSGTANAVTLGPLVGVTTTGSAGQPYAELWQPLSGATLGLGNARIGGIDVGGWAVGESDSGRAWYAAPTGTAGTVAVHTLPWSGYLHGITDFNWAYGYRIEDGGPRPVLARFSDITSYKLDDFKLSLGFRYGELLDVNAGGVAVGEEFKDRRDFKLSIGTPVYYPDGPDHPTLLSTTLSLPAGVRLEGIASISDNNFLGGFGEFDLSRHVRYLRALLLDPDPEDKLDEIANILWWDEALTGDEAQVVSSSMSEIEGDLDDGDDEEACAAIDSLGGDMDEWADYLDDFYGDYAAEAVATFDDLGEVLYELHLEVGCSDELSLALLPLEPAQSPFYDTPLSPPASTPGTTITTTVGPPTITGP